MSKVIPHGADSDPSYELVADMTDAEGNTYCRPTAPAPPIVTQDQGLSLPTDPDAGNSPGPDTTPVVTIFRDQDRRLPFELA